MLTTPALARPWAHGHPTTPTSTGISSQNNPEKRHRSHYLPNSRVEVANPGRRWTRPPWPWRRPSASSPPTRSAASRTPASRRSTTWYAAARFLFHFRGTAILCSYLPPTHPIERIEKKIHGAVPIRFFFLSDLVCPFGVRRRPCRRRRRDPESPYVLINLS